MIGMPWDTQWRNKVRSWWRWQVKPWWEKRLPFVTRKAWNARERAHREQLTVMRRDHERALAEAASAFDEALHRIAKVEVERPRGYKEHFRVSMAVNADMLWGVLRHGNDRVMIAHIADRFAREVETALIGLNSVRRG